MILFKTKVPLFSEFPLTGRILCVHIDKYTKVNYYLNLNPKKKVVRNTITRFNKNMYLWDVILWDLDYNVIYVKKLGLLYKLEKYFNYKANLTKYYILSLIQDKVFSEQYIFPNWKNCFDIKELTFSEYVNNRLFRSVLSLGQDL